MRSTKTARMLLGALFFALLVGALPIWRAWQTRQAAERQMDQLPQTQPQAEIFSLRNELKSIDEVLATLQRESASAEVGELREQRDALAVRLQALTGLAVPTTQSGARTP